MMKTSTPSPRPSPSRERAFCDTLIKGEGVLLQPLSDGEGSGKEAA